MNTNHGATLMAASKDLLEALDSMMELIWDFIPPNELNDIQKLKYDKALSVAQKAKGIK